jgi:DNA-binding CsgD family transcriptional regulator
MALAILAEIAIRRNDLAAAAERLEQGWHLVHGGVDWTAQHLAWSSALLEDAQGKREAALANLEAGPLPLTQRIDLIAADHAVGPATVRIALRAGARELARAVADRTDQAAARNPSVGSLAAAAEHCRALIAGDLDSLERAILRWRESGRVPALADACEDAGRLALAGDDKARAREWLQEAYRAHEQLTADAGVARVAEALRSLGVRRRRAAKTVAAGSGWGSLTEAERKIAALVAEGLSNPQIAERRYISRHTVESHLKHIYLKLAIGSRVELAKLALTHTPQS